MGAARNDFTWTGRVGRYAPVAGRREPAGARGGLPDATPSL